MAELQKEAFEQTVYCSNCFDAIHINVPPEASATEAMMWWVNSDQLCVDCKKKERS